MGWIDLFENAPIDGGLAKCNPLAYWTLEDTFDYIAKYDVPHHPLHAQGYPSHGDAKDTIPIPEDGSTKTECGIHVEGAEKTFDRDLWEEGSVKNISSEDEAIEIIKAGKAAVITVYAPWCQFCQGMEDEYAKFASESDIDVYKFRGDELRDFVSQNLNTESFPTVNVVKPDGTIVKYDSEVRTADAFKAFVERTLA